jgi:hypothetical protein
VTINMPTNENTERMREAFHSLTNSVQALEARVQAWLDEVRTDGLYIQVRVYQMNIDYLRHNNAKYFEQCNSVSTKHRRPYSTVQRVCAAAAPPAADVRCTLLL